MEKFITLLIIPRGFQTFTETTSVSVQLEFSFVCACLRSTQAFYPSLAFVIISYKNDTKNATKNSKVLFHFHPHHHLTVADCIQITNILWTHSTLDSQELQVSNFHNISSNFFIFSKFKISNYFMNFELEIFSFIAWNIKKIRRKKKSKVSPYSTRNNQMKADLRKKREWIEIKMNRRKSSLRFGKSRRWKRRRRRNFCESKSFSMTFVCLFLWTSFNFF